MESRETVLSSPHRKRKPSEEPNTQCAVKSAMLSPGESPTPAPRRRPRSRRSAPHLGKSATKKLQVKTQTPECSAKRQRMRTASALGVENVAVAVAAAAKAVDRSGQICPPGWDRLEGPFFDGVPTTSGAAPEATDAGVGRHHIGVKFVPFQFFPRHNLNISRFVTNDTTGL